MHLSNYSNDIKPIFSGHETFPLRYGWLKKVHDAMADAESKSLNAKNIFNNPESIATFGVGKNMVSSMRHWSTHTGIIKDNKLTDVAKELLSSDGLDPWMENPTTIWLIHWNLVSNKNLVTYHWFFNHYNGGSFDRGYINSEILSLCESKDIKQPSETTLKRDVECFIRLYHNKDTVSDDSIESPLAELGLIKSVDKQKFTPNRGFKANLSPALFALCMIDFWMNHSPNGSSISLDSLLYDANSPGRIFLLDEMSLLDLIYSACNLMEDNIYWSETAGMRQLAKTPKHTLEELYRRAQNLIKEEYRK